MPSKPFVPFAAALAAAVLAGCENTPPGAGLTNGPAPTTTGAEDKPAVRTDLQEPDATGGDAAIAADAVPATGPVPTTKEVVPAQPGAEASGDAGAGGSAKP